MKKLVIAVVIVSAAALTGCGFNNGCCGEYTYSSCCNSYTTYYSSYSTSGCCGSGGW
ncbi:hypothetical protein ACFORL_09930 [Legionella dresdenensis]|uniref:Lipoprotein n=1 Tax=Legionella dresdenensis TaxID=450200 RepID=A0ABV8CGS5_9GAMM